MNWFKGGKKLVFLMEQEEELYYSLDRLEKNRSSVGIVYTGDWDIEIRAWHENRLASIEMIYPHISILEGLSFVDRGRLNEVKEILCKGPVPLSIREMFSTTYENMMPYHRRNWNKYGTYADLLDKLCVLHDYLSRIPCEMYPDVIIMPEKIGWMRKYISYFFYSKNVPLCAFMGLRYDQKYALEICHQGKLRYLGQNGLEIFKQDISEKYLSEVDIGEYRSRENKELGRNAMSPFLRALWRHLSQIPGATRVYLSNILLLGIRGRVTSSFNESWNKYTVASNFYLSFFLGLWWFIKDYTSWAVGYQNVLYSNNKYILVPLQHYPETSTVGEFSYVQTEIQYFEQLLNAFDDTDRIIVVEHPTTMFSGERARWIRNFFKLTRGVEFHSILTPTGIPFEVINKAEAVVTIIGGISIENALCGGKSFISVLHPMLFIKNISLLDIPINKKLEKCLDLGDTKLSAKEYCALTKKYGLDRSEILRSLVEDYDLFL